MLEQSEKTELATDTHSILTTRECEIALLTMKGLTNRAIARELHLCQGTVKIHLHNIFRKLGIKSRAALIVRGTQR